MGYNPGFLALLAEWKQHGLYRGAGVLDIGMQELFCQAEAASLNRFLSEFGGTLYDEAEQARVADYGLAGELLERAGFRYRAVDITAGPRTITLDLNRDRLPFWHRGKYALVTNCGTTEHVLNQLNAFRLIHDACKIDGLMYHGVPMAGDFSHGLFNYNPRFFTRLKEANAYEIVSRWIWAADESRTYSEIEEAEPGRDFACQDAWVHYLLRRKSAAPFREPMDCIEAHSRIR